MLNLSRTLTIGCSALLVSACLPAVAADGASAPMASSTKGGAAVADTAFVNAAAVGGLTEVKLGQLAATNGDSAAVKSFGQHMVDDHTKANDELGAIAKGKGATPPSAPDKSHQAIVDKFSSLKGAAFDKAFWKQMHDDHVKTIALFEKESSSGKDADIKAFATKTLPTLKMHLQMVQDAMKGKA
jgi:putative membrane protein